MAVEAPLIQTGVALAGVAGVAAGALVYGYFKRGTTKETSDIQTANIQALKEQALIHATQLAEQKVQIAELQSEVRVVKTIPLDGIHENLAQLAGDFSRMSTAMASLSETVSRQQEEIAKFIKHKTKILQGIAKLAQASSAGTPTRRAIDKQVRDIMSELVEDTQKEAPNSK